MDYLVIMAIIIIVSTGLHSCNKKEVIASPTS